MGDEIQELDQVVKVRGSFSDIISLRCLLNIQGRGQVGS